MRPHPRIRKVVKWGGLAVAGLLVAVWTATLWTAVYHFDGSSNLFMLAQGSVRYTIERIPAASNPHQGWHTMSNDRTMVWRPEWEFHQSFYLCIVPLWIPLLLTAIPTALAWHLDTLARRRAKMHTCTSCGYDLAGLTHSATCPECGKACAPPPGHQYPRKGSQ